MTEFVLAAFAGVFAGRVVSSVEEFVSELNNRIKPSPSCANLPSPSSARLRSPSYAILPLSSIASVHIPKLPTNRVNLDFPVWELKRRLFKDNFKKVGVSAIGGSGKTTLVAALCRDAEVKNHFGDKIFFQTVSEFPDNKTILESIWKKISGDQAVLDSQSIREALQERLTEKPEKILVILDDVGPDVNLEELLFQAEEYKTVVTARDTVNFKYLDTTYDLPLLGEKDALSLFCYSAFGQESIPDEGYNKQLVKEVAKECHGLPLTLEVIGHYLHKEMESVYWEDAKRQLSQGGWINKAYEYGVLKRLAVSIESLDNDMKECFLDLIVFPEVKSIPVDALFDIWIHVHNLSPINACNILLDLVRRKLLSLVHLGESMEIDSHNACGIYVVQHDVVRNSAIYWAANNQTDKICKRLRLYQPFSNWEKHSHMEAAEVIAIYTGAVKENEWPKVKFPKAQALVLIFAGNEYFLPKFLKKMPELKVLIIMNQNSSRAILNGPSIFSSMAHLKSLRLEKLIVPLQDHCQYLKNLRKLSLSLCNTDNGLLDEKGCSKLLKLEEINIGYCENIKELPVGICNLTSLKKLSITNCHQLHKIPDNLDKLAGSLDVLMLVSCPNLKELPASICDLGKLRFLDISQCQCLERLPSGFGKLQSLQILNMGECKNIKKLPEVDNGLASLTRVICDERLEKQWSGVRGSINLKIAEPKFGLEWLDT